MFCYWIAGTNNEEIGLFTISMCLKTASVTATSAGKMKVADIRRFEAFWKHFIPILYRFNQA